MIETIDPAKTPRPTTRRLGWSRASLALALLASAVAAQDLPSRLLIGYWHNWGYSPNNLTLAQLPPDYDVINVAFATPSTPLGSTMVFVPDAQLYPNAAQFPADVQALQAQGKKVLISIGGANGPVQLLTATDVTNFVSSMLSIITTHGFDGLDIDLEGSSLGIDPGDQDFQNPTSPKVVNFIAAVTQLLGMLPADFMLTAAPETATLQGAVSAYAGVWGAYLPVIHALRNQLDWVQVQHYNTGPMVDRNGQLQSPATADFHVAMADMLMTGFFVPAAGAFFPPLDPSQVVIGLPASPLAAGTGFTPAPIVHAALDHLYLGLSAGSNYPLGNSNGYEHFRGLMTWSINWDLHAASSFSQSHRSYLDSVNLATDTQTVLTGSGGSVHFSLRAGVAHAGRAYFLVPTLSGTSPGTWLPGNRNFPINLDGVSDWPFRPATSGFFGGFAGFLDAQGSGSAALVVPPGVLPGTISAHYAFVLSYPWEFASAAVQVDFMP